MFSLDDRQKAEKIKNSYLPQEVEKTKMQELKELDARVKRPVNIFSYVFGSVGSLVFGTGMCVAMGVIGGLMPIGIGLGLVGIGMVSANYPIYRKILQKRKAKYSKQIIEKSNLIIEGKEYTPTSEYVKSNQVVSEYSKNGSVIYKDNEHSR